MLVLSMGLDNIVDVKTMFYGQYKCTGLEERFT